MRDVITTETVRVGSKAGSIVSRENVVRVLTGDNRSVLMFFYCNSKKKESAYFPVIMEAEDHELK